MSIDLRNGVWLSPRKTFITGWSIINLVMEDGVGEITGYVHQRGYVKIYNPSGRMVDTALTVEAAIKRITHYMIHGEPNA